MVCERTGAAASASKASKASSQGASKKPATRDPGPRLSTLQRPLRTFAAIETIYETL